MNLSYCHRVAVISKPIETMRVFHCTKCGVPCFTVEQVEKMERNRKLRYQEMDGIIPTGHDDGIIRGTIVDNNNKCKIN